MVILNRKTRKIVIDKADLLLNPSTKQRGTACQGGVICEDKIILVIKGAMVLKTIFLPNNSEAIILLLKYILSFYV